MHCNVLMLKFASVRRSVVIALSILIGQVLPIGASAEDFKPYNYYHWTFLPKIEFDTAFKDGKIDIQQYKTDLENKISEYKTRTKPTNENGINDLKFRLAVTGTFFYLKTGEKTYLQDSCARLKALNEETGNYNNKIVYWYHYAASLMAITERKPEDLIDHVFLIWRDVINNMATGTYYYANDKNNMISNNVSRDSLINIYDNIADLVLIKAIKENKMENIDPLGSIILIINPWMQSRAYFSKRVASIAKSMESDHPDHYLLIFTAAMNEGDMLNNTFQVHLSNNGFDREAQNLFKETMGFYDYALNNAKQNAFAKAKALKAKLNLISYAVGRLHDNYRSIDSKLFFRDTALNDWIIIANDASQVTKDLIQNSQSQPSYYFSVIADLWQAIMESSIIMQYTFSSKVGLNDGAFQDDELPNRAAELYLALFDKYVCQTKNYMPSRAVYYASQSADTSRRYICDKAKSSLNRDFMENCLKKFEKSFKLNPFDLSILQQMIQTLRENFNPHFYSEKIFPVAASIKKSTAFNNFTNGDAETMTFIDFIPNYIKNPYLIVEFKQEINTTSNFKEKKKSARKSKSKLAQDTTGNIKYQQIIYFEEIKNLDNEKKDIILKRIDENKVNPRYSDELRDILNGFFFESDSCKP